MKTIKLEGIIPPLITPLKDRDTLDRESLENLIEHLIQGGVHGIFILGTTGEAPSLSYKLRKNLIEEACKIVSGRIPVLVGITDTSFVESLNMASHAADSGASGLVAAPPYYFPAGQPELLEYIEHLARQLQLPLVLYNMPSHTKLYFEPDTVRAAFERSLIAGLKDSSGNMVYFHRLRQMFRDNPNFSLLVGPEELLAESVFLGGNGGVCGGANIFPRLYVQLYEYAKKGNIAKALELHDKVMYISENIYRTGKYASSIIKGIKCALNLKKIISSDFMAEPFHRFKDEERKIIEEKIALLE